MAFTIKPAWVDVGRVRVEQRTLESEWTAVCDNTWSSEQPTTEVWRRVHASRRRETVSAARRIEVSRFTVDYEAWSDVVTVNGVAQPAPVALVGGSYAIEVAPPRVVVTGEPAAGIPRVEFEYAKTRLIDPVFATAPLRPLQVGADVEQLADLVQQLLYRSARGPGGYSPDMGIAIRVALARVEAGASRFDVRVEPAPDPTRVSHATLAGELVIGPDGWPSALRLAGTHDGFFNDRRGATQRAGTLALTVTWYAS
jgi:hypothetical protein